ncbi:MAG TPA: glycosyltransferase [Thermoleophilaceae bacterium]
MRALFSSTRGAGHFNPLVPFARAFERAGHQVLVAGPPDLTAPVEGAGFSYWRFDPPPEEELGPIWARVPSLSEREQNEVVIGQIFGRLNTTAALPRLRAAFGEWHPEVVIHDPNEFASPLAAELHGVPHARVAISLSSTEGLALDMAAEELDRIRRAEGLAPDPGADALRGSPFLSVFPRSFDEGEQPDTHRFRDPAWAEPARELPDWWPGRADEPLVYVTFGSVAGGFDEAARVYSLALAAVADLPARVLLTVGRELDLSTLPPAPGNVRIEPWVPQQDVLPHAAAAVVHGGSGSTLGALAAGVPLVVLPLFADQPMNARRVAEVGAGIAVVPDREDPPKTLAELRAAIETVLAEPSFGERARELAAELAGEPPVDEAVALLERIAKRSRQASD